MHCVNAIISLRFNRRMKVHDAMPTEHPTFVRLSVLLNFSFAAAAAPRPSVAEKPHDERFATINNPHTSHLPQSKRSELSSTASDVDRIADKTNTSFSNAKKIKLFTLREQQISWTWSVVCYIRSRVHLSVVCMCHNSAQFNRKYICLNNFVTFGQLYADTRPRFIRLLCCVWRGVWVVRHRTMSAIVKHAPHIHWAETELTEFLLKNEINAFISIISWVAWYD